MMYHCNGNTRCIMIHFTLVRQIWTNSCVTAVITYSYGSINSFPHRDSLTNHVIDRYPDSKVHGANMGPIWGRQDPGGPHVDPMNFAIWVHYTSRLWPGVGVTKPISSVPLFSEIFSIAKTHVCYWISRLYLTGVAAAQLRWHLSNINVIQII